MESFNNKKLGNRYTLLEKVGDGGMALVYKARCELLNRYVAVKILRPEYMSDEDFVKKFKSESQAVASLSHPNIVNIYDVGNEEGVSYIVMEYVEGIDLKDYIKKHGSLSYQEGLKIVKQIAGALEHAHKNGVIHRDVKPHNILITNDGIVKVADFGIAKAATSATMTNTKTVMGSVHYVSPEQAKGSFVDKRTDIYSLGIVMYELLTGKVPFDADSPVSVAIKHIQEDIKNPSELKDIPKGVCDIIIKATQKDPLNRYQDLTEMINDIETAEKTPNIGLNSFGGVDETTRIIPIEEIESAINEGTRKINPVNKNEFEDEEEFGYEEEAEEEDFDDYKLNKIKNITNKKKGNKLKSLIKVVISVGVLIVLLGTGVAFWASSTSNEVTIPNIVGMTESEAKSKLEDLKLDVEITKTKSDKESGEVIEVYPEVGRKVKEKSTVKLTVSEGQNMVKVPNVKKMSRDEAISTLESEGFVIGSVDEKYSSSVKEGMVISQSLNANEEVAEGSTIDLVVSKGEEKKMTSVPSLEGKTLDEVKSELSSAKLKLGSIKYKSDLTKPDGVVIEQSISSGSSVNEGSSVNIVVNKITTPTEPKDDDKDNEKPNNNQEKPGTDNSGQGSSTINNGRSLSGNGNSYNR